MKVFACIKEHGPMVARDPAGQTREQLFCGVWYDCQHSRCRSSALIASPGLTRQLGEQQV